MSKTATLFSCFNFQVTPPWRGVSLRDGPQRTGGRESNLAPVPHGTSLGFTPQLSFGGLCFTGVGLPQISHYCCLFFSSNSGLRIRNTLMRIWNQFQLFINMLIRVQLFTLMRIRIRLIKVMGICSQLSIDPAGLHFEPPGLHCERPRPHHGSIFSL